MTAENSSTLGAEDLGEGNKRILIIGNSHTQMIKNALENRAKLGQPVENLEVCWLISRGKGDFGNTMREDAIAKIQKLEPSALLVLTLLGTLHNMIGLFNQDPPFSLADSVERPAELTPGTQIIPHSIMRDMFKEHVEGNKFFSLMVSSARCRVVHFAPPPPKETFAKTGKTRIFDGATVRLEFAPKQNRLALWKLEQSVVADYLAGLNVAHCPLPPGTTTPDGFLAPDFHAKDATHANSAFGEVLLQEFERMVHDVPRKHELNS